MTGVLIAADQSDKKMWRTLPELLQRNLSAVHFTKEIGNQNPKLVIAALEDAPEFHPDDAIIIFKEITSAPTSFTMGKRTVAVVDAAGDRCMLEKVSETMLPAITCGLSARDTITLSSMASDSAVITLQRSITCFDGSVAEPQEIPISLSAAVDSFTLMAVSAVFLLTGNIERLKDAKF